MRRGVLALGLALILSLAACSTQSELRFTNRTDCGPATILLTNTVTGGTSTYTLEQERTLAIQVEAEVVYRYEVTYPRDPARQIECEPKTVEVRLRPGQRLNISLESVPEGA